MKTPELSAQVEELANAILLGPAGEVEAGFSALCAAHEEFRPALERLRADFERAAHLFAAPMPGAPLPLPAPIGPYRFLRQIGEGAFGVVFLAEQQEPIRRQVAIKLLHAGVYSQSAVARFLNERETLARMNHSAIARIFDAGVDAQGRPHFVMEYVPGEPLHTFVARRAPSLAARIELFLEVCEGVSHAHQRGVIHRDLKPHNILVSEVDGKFVPKVIDFGLAKVFADDAVRNAVQTHAGAVLGTPAYMSPEQVRGDALDVDTRTDVYSLGVILYELLTGSLPLAREQYRSTTLAEFQRLLHAEPPLASARAMQSRAPHASRLRGDLDWILRKAMARRSTERYASVADLAADLRRHLAHEPVLAGPPSARYVLRKFVRRHRVTVVAGATVAMALLLGLAVSTKLYREARANARTATEHLGDFWRLADVLELEELLAEEKDLWPSSPARLAEHERWLERARGLVDRRAAHARAVHELDQRLSGSLTTGSPSQEERGARFLRDRMRKLVAGLEDFGRDRGALRVMQSRTEFARTVLERTVSGMSAAWARATAAVTASGRFAGLELRPIVGLVPLGPDPSSGLEEFAHLQSGTVPARAADGLLVIGDDTAIVLVLVPGGDVLIGSQAKDPQQPHFDPHRTAFETDATTARIDAFLIGKYELTQAQVQALGVPSQSLGRAGQPSVEGTTFSLRHPEESVLAPVVESWLRHFELRLPASAEWEVAARGASSTAWFTGNEVESLQGYVNVADATLGDEKEIVKPWDGRVRDGYLTHAPVGTFLPNGYGLHDVLGNVAELTLGEARWKGGLSYLARGGSYMLRPIESRIGSLRLVPQNQTTPEIGVRVARSLTR